MNFSDDEAPAKTEKPEEIPPLSENDSDDDGPPPLELAGPPPLEEIPAHHQDNLFQNQPLDDVINSYTVMSSKISFFNNSKNSLQQSESGRKENCGFQRELENTLLMKISSQTIGTMKNTILEPKTLLLLKLLENLTLR